MDFVSLFSGVGGFDLGFENAGMNCIRQVEIDKFATNILAKHWPNVERGTDVREEGITTIATTDLICGGFPCQDLSVAGKRAGLAGERSGLWNEYHRIISEVRPRWVVIENVPGLLSSNKGQDVGILAGSLAKLGYWWAYRVLNSQYFGVAQRRRRVFIVGHLAEPTYPTKVLFESESCEWDTETSKEKRKGYTPLAARADCPGNDQSPYLIDARQDPVVEKNISLPLGAKDNGHAFIDNTTWTIRGGKEGGGKGYLGQESLAMTLGGQPQYVGVRRLTPLECERLQGFPDGWTDSESDTQRYKMMGNAVTVNVAEWIGKRIVQLDRTGHLC